MLFVGGMVPVVFSALAMNAVGKAAMEMVNEVVRQFKEIPGIMEGTGKPEYDKCVDYFNEGIFKGNDVTRTLNNWVPNTCCISR